MRNEPTGPINTADIKLSDELANLTERLAANVHDRWMQQRQAEQWQYGEKRDDDKKQSPLLVPYENLPESEKEYDRITAMETVKSILALGFTISPPASNGPPEISEEMLARWERSQSISELLSARRFVQEKNISEPRPYGVLAHQLLRKGEPLLAYDVAREGLKFAKDDVRLQQLQALALARSGATGPANRILNTLWEAGHQDAETAGMLARTNKDLWLMLCDKREGAGHLERAHALYKKGYENANRDGKLDGAIYNGINAASTALLMGDKEAAARLADEVKTLCDRRDPPDYWSLASKAEARLVRQDLAAAAPLYSEAAQHCGTSSGDLSATRRQARLLLTYLGEDPRSLDDCFPVPAIRVLHTALRLPSGPKQYEEVREQAKSAAPKDGKQFFYMSVLAYPDLAVLEAFLDSGHELHVVLPVSPDGCSMADEHGVTPERLQSILDRCASVLVASGLRTKSSQINTQYTELLRDGLALLHAQSLDAELVNEDLVRKPQGMFLQAARLMPGQQRPITSSKERVRAILFADAVNFSRLNEDQVEIFSRDFLGAIADVIHRSLHRPLLQKTWGDGLCIVFETLSDAGQFALELRDRIVGTNWAAAGLPEELSLRIALHAGPVFEILDPITEHVDFTGVHMSQGARIEPRTPAGQVYASKNFAALVAAQMIHDFRCEYVGQMPLAKDYGTFPLYHVTSRDCRL